MRDLLIAIVIYAAVTVARIRFAVDLGPTAPHVAALQAWTAGVHRSKVRSAYANVRTALALVTARSTEAAAAMRALGEALKPFTESPGK